MYRLDQQFLPSEMKPSYQYQPVNLQKKFSKSPNFLTSKLLDKSAPNLNPQKPSVLQNKFSTRDKELNNNPNKSSYISSKLQSYQTTSGSSKNLMQKNSSTSGYASNPSLKFLHSPQLKKNQQRYQRPNRGQMSRSLVIQEVEPNQIPSYLETSRKAQETKYVPQRRAPRMSQGYQPNENNFMQTNEGKVDNQQSPSFLKDRQGNFRKIKKLNQDSKQKKPNIPAFLQKNPISSMKRSSLEIYNYNSNEPQKATSFSSATNLFSSSRQRKKFTASDFAKIKQLGNGKYGRVYLVKQKHTGFVCALKVIEKKLLVEEQITEQFIRQLKIQMYLNHPNIIKMYGYFDDQKNIYIILQVGTGGQLYHQLKKSQSLPEAKVAFFMRQICDAVNQIHSLRIIHRDIKPQNIVMHDNIIKLCDFGWSVHQDNKLRTTFCGTPLYVCPQILRGKQYDEKIDIWSLGIMMYEMVVGQNPFKITKEEELIKIVKQEIKIPSYVYVSEEARDFLDKCLQKNPNDRVTIRELISHRFFKKYQQKDKKSFNL